MTNHPELYYVSPQIAAVMSNRFFTIKMSYDVQHHIIDCLKNRTKFCEFALNIPMFSNEKLVRMIVNDVAEQGKLQSVLYEAEVGFSDGKFNIKFKYKD